MVVTMNPSADPNPVKSALLPDESSLKLLFDEQYEPLRKRATAQLPDAESAAPRVVEQAFLHAWRERAAFTSRDQLLAFLQEDVDHGAIRTMNRRSAAHRLASHGHESHGGNGHHANGTTVDAPAVWHHIEDALHASADEHARARQEAARLAHHDTAQHIAATAKKTPWGKIIGVLAATVLLVGAIFYVLDRAGTKVMVAKAVDGPDAEVIESMPTQLGSVTLADGSIAKLGADSRVRIPKLFNETARAIRAEGAVQLTVAPGKLPFELYVGRAVVTVTGTTLTIRAYPMDSTALITLQEGSATVAIGNETRDLAPGAGLFVPAVGAVREANPGEVAEATTWAVDTLTVENRPLKLALQEVRRWYGDAIVADTISQDRPVSFRAPLGQIRSAIEQIEKSGNVKFGYVANAMVFQDAASVGLRRKQ